MKLKALPLARFLSSLSLFGILLCTHLCFALVYFLPPGWFQRGYAVGAFFFAGAAAGAVLCPLFLPVPRKAQSAIMGITFIAALVAAESIFHFLGFREFLDSAIVRAGIAISVGMLTTVCYGLFYLTWLRVPANGHGNRTGRYCSLAAGAALLGAVLARYYSVPLIETHIAAGDPLLGAAFIFDLLQWCIIILGASTAITVFLLRKADCAPVCADPIIKTDRTMILRLIGLASVFTILNAVLNMRMLPLYADIAVYHPHYITVALAVLLLTLLAGRSTDRFIRRFTPPTVVLFILISCLPLFESHPQVNMIMSTLLATAHYTAWVVFTTAVVELYAGGFWFYGMAAVIFFTAAFAGLAPVVNPFVPEGTEYRVLFIVIAAVVFMLLAFRWLLFPKQRPASEVSPLDISNIEDIFQERGLSQREIEVAHLLVTEGLGKQEIGERLFIAPGTAKLHISKIYQKFGVTNRAEFMALVVQRWGGVSSPLKEPQQDAE
ncbi:MAG: helix-turn-helix transcriptional regulator [Spirochaetota bacterium]|jgi:DNA-binding CsgD family transcriptional regulator|nr:helix-turn-helix transcriptional regulator [Spirochaetota bacterium]